MFFGLGSANGWRISWEWRMTLWRSLWSTNWRQTKYGDRYSLLCVHIEYSCIKWKAFNLLIIAMLIVSRWPSNTDKLDWFLEWEKRANFHCRAVGHALISAGTGDGNTLLDTRVEAGGNQEAKRKLYMCPVSLKCLCCCTPSPLINITTLLKLKHFKNPCK